MATEGGPKPIHELAEAAMKAYPDPNLGKKPNGGKGLLGKTGDFVGRGFHGTGDVAGHAVGAAGGHLRQVGGGLTYVATHPGMWGGVAKRGVVGWVGNTLHPLDTAKNLAFDRKKLTKHELAWYAGALEGAVETYIIYSALPPGTARLMRAGLSFAWSQLPTALMYLAEVRQKGNIAKRSPDKSLAEMGIKSMEDRHDKAKGYLSEFCKGRRFAGTVVPLATVGGLMEAGAEAALRSTGVDVGGMLNKGFNKIQETIYGDMDQKINQVMDSEAFAQATEKVMQDPSYGRHLNVLTDNTVMDLLNQKGLTITTEGSWVPNVPGDVYDKVHNAIESKAQQLLQDSFEAGAKQSLEINSDNIAQAAVSGQRKLADVVVKTVTDTPEHKAWLVENQEILDQALASHADMIVSGEAFDSAVSNIYRTQEFVDKLYSFDSQTIREAFSQDFSSGWNEKVGERVSDLINARTDDWAIEQIEEGAKTALLENPNLSPEAAAELGKQHMYKELEALHNNPEEYKKLLDENKSIIAKAIEDDKAGLLPDIPPASPRDVLANHAEKLAKLHPEYSREVLEKALKESAAAGVGQYIDQSFNLADEAIKAEGLDPRELSETAYERVRMAAQHAMENQANSSYINTDGKEIQVILDQGQKNFFKAINSPEIHERLLVGAKEAVKSYVLEEKTFDSSFNSALSAAQETNPDLVEVVEIEHGDTAGGLLVEEGGHDFSNWSSPDAIEAMAVTAAANHEMLEDYWSEVAEKQGWPPSFHYPVGMSEVYSVAEAAKNGDALALQRLKDALWMLPEDEKIKILKKAGVKDLYKFLGQLKKAA